jgi:hypothetical protein
MRILVVSVLPDAIAARLPVRSPRLERTLPAQ